MTKRPRVGVGGSHWRGPIVAAAVVRTVAAGLIAVGVSVGGPGVAVASAQLPASDGGFTAEQAAAGWTEYARQCGECHGEGLDGAEAPACAGSTS